MKLAEALRLRSDLEKKISNLKNRIKTSATVKEGDTAPEKAEELMKELDECLMHTEELIYRINSTNMQTLYNGETLTRLIARKDILVQRLKIMKEILEHTSSYERYGKNELMTYRLIDIPQLQKSYDDYAKQLRELDLKLQEMNWTTELI